MRILVTGGAGYIGGQVVRALLGSGHAVVVLDNLSSGHREALAGLPGVPLVAGDVADRDALDACFAAGRIDGAVHMAACCLVGESMQRPHLYYDNNVVRPLRLLRALAERGVSRFVLSSSAAVYGEPEGGLGASLTEESPCRPTNVYGETKRALEVALEWLARLTGLRAVALRYFNAAGADPSGDAGEHHDPETHLIPLVLRAALGRAPHVTVLGTDYPTPDGSCVRDYVHVADLADAHVLALEALDQRDRPPALQVYNLGSGRPASVLEVVEAARRVTGRPIPIQAGPRRPGDPALLVATSGRIERELGWRPRRSDLDTILADAWEWHRRHPDGYASRT